MSRNGDAIDLNPRLAETRSERTYPFDDVNASSVVDKREMLIESRLRGSVVGVCRE